MDACANRISQPGWTGNAGVLRIAKAAQRTAMSDDPNGDRSIAASSRNVSSPFGSSMLRIRPPVSVGLRTIETGGSNLAQRQDPRAFAPRLSRCKSRKTRVYGDDIRGCRHPRLIRDRRNVERSEASCSTREDPSGIRLSRCRNRNSREVERERPSLAGASSGLKLSNPRIRQDRQSGSSAHRGNGLRRTG